MNVRCLLPTWLLAAGLLAMLPNDALAIRFFEDPATVISLSAEPTDMILVPSSSGGTELLVLDDRRRVTFFDLSASNPWSPVQVVEADGGDEFSGSGQLQFVDMNEDGTRDLVVVSRDVFIVPGLPAGGFGSPLVWSMNSNGGVITEDLNGDGHRDLGVPGSGFSLLQMRAGRGDGRFGPIVSLGTAATYQSPVATRDVDHDGDLDVLTESSAPPAIMLWTNDGQGQFTGRVAATLDSLFSGYVLGLAHLNDDDEPDMVLIGYPKIVFSDTLVTLPSWRVVTTYLGTGGGQFGSAAWSDSLTNGTELFLADLDGDGLDDLVRHEGSLVMRKSRSDGSFDPPRNLGATDASGPILSWEVDGDGRPDFLMRGRTSMRVLTAADLENKPLDPPYRVPYGDGLPIALDVTGDGLPDLVGTGTVGNGNSVLYVLRATPAGRFEEPDTYPIQDTGNELQSGDVDGDGDMDIILKSYDLLSVVTNDGLGGFSEGVRSMLPTHFDFRFTIADMDGDGRDELVCSVNDIEVNGIQIWRLHADLPPEILFRIDFEHYGIGQVGVRDLDGDGRLDLYVPQFSLGLRRLINRGQLTFDLQPGEPLPDEAPDAVYFGDWLGDEQLELLAVGYQQFELLVPDGEGGWVRERRLSGPNDLGDVFVLENPDFNGDDRPDIFLQRYSFQGGSRVLLSEPGRGLGDSVPLELPGNSSNARLVDVDGDGVRDVIVRYNYYDELLIRRGLPIAPVLVGDWRVAVDDWTVTCSWSLPAPLPGELSLHRQSLPAGFKPEIEVSSDAATMGIGSSTDRTVPAPGRYQYRLVHTDADGYARTVALSTVEVRPDPGPIRLLSVTASPGPGPFRLVYESRQAAALVLEVFAPNGRRVRRLDVVLLPGQRGELEWNGRADNGVPVASGIYFARLVGVSGVLRLVVVR